MGKTVFRCWEVGEGVRFDRVCLLGSKSRTVDSEANYYTHQRSAVSDIETKESSPLRKRVCYRSQNQEDTRMGLRDRIRLYYYYSFVSLLILDRCFSGGVLMN